MNQLNMVSESLKYVGITREKKNILVNYYNHHCVDLVKPNRRYKIKYSDNWCAMFTSVIAHKVGLDVGLFPYEVSVGEQVKIAREREQFTTDETKIREGDLVVYNWNRDSWADHVGIVKSFKDGVLEVIEGNHKQTVGIRKLTLPNRVVYGFILI